MSEQTKHTTLPWRISGNEREVYANDPNGFTCAFVVADCSGKESFGPLTTKHNHETSKANVEFIVHACNCFDDLVSALTRDHALLCELRDGILAYSKTTDEIEAACEQGSAALNKTKGV